MVNTHINFENDPSRVRVAVQYPNSDCFLGCNDAHSDYTAGVELTIQVPKHTNLKLSGHKPDVKISSIEGDLQIHSYKSPIDIESTTGGIDIETYKESVHLRDVSVRGPLHLTMQKGEATIQAKSLGDEVNIETEKGSVVLGVPRTAGLTIDYSGGRRANFHSDLPITSETGFRSNEMRGTVNGGGTRLRLRTEKGSISLESMR
jgi:putative adhesin